VNAAEKYINRCFELAVLSGKAVKTNPNVGAVLVYNDKIIGEGYHQAFGESHAEKNAIASVSANDRKLIPHSRLYVSLEPCCIESKTPACTELILNNKINALTVSVEDPHLPMRGKSLALLSNKGVKLESGILRKKGYQLILPFLAQLSGRPYIILKWAQSRDNYIGKRNQHVWLSNHASKVKVHGIRAQADGILVGYQTALQDNPKLTTRLVPGDQPARIVIDRHLSLPRSHHLWNDRHKSIFVCDKASAHLPKQENPLKEVEAIDYNVNMESQICQLAFKRGLFRIIVEGGAKTLKGFIDSGLWDEARVFRTPVVLTKGVTAPFISARNERMERFLDDELYYYFNDSHYAALL